MESFADLWGKTRTILPKGRVLDERAELVKWFCNKMEREARQIGPRLAHLSVEHLYTIQSEYKDIVNRRGYVPGVKYLWAITRTELAPAV